MRADAFFTSLTKRQTMLLLTAVTFGGAEGVGCFDHLPEDEAEVLKERAAQILAVPRERRVPFLVQEIKRLVVGRRGGNLQGADPTLVAQALQGERPALAEVILRALPAHLAGQVRDAIPPSSVKLARDVQPEILSVIRWHFEARLNRLAPRPPSFSFADLLTLSNRSLLTLAGHLGADALAPAVAGLPDAERAQCLAELAAEERGPCARAASSVAAEDRLRPEIARRALQQAIGEGALADPRHAVRRAGLSVIVRACLADSAELVARLAERHRDELGKLLVQVIRAERGGGHRPSGRDRALQGRVVGALEALAQQGLVDRPVRLRPPGRGPLPRVGPPPLPARALDPARSRGVRGGAVVPGRTSRSLRNPDDD